MWYRSWGQVSSAPTGYSAQPSSKSLNCSVIWRRACYHRELRRGQAACRPAMAAYRDRRRRLFDFGVTLEANGPFSRNCPTIGDCFREMNLRRNYLRSHTLTRIRPECSRATSRLGGETSLLPDCVQPTPTSSRSCHDVTGKDFEATNPILSTIYSCLFEFDAPPPAGPSRPFSQFRKTINPVCRQV